MDSSEYEDLTPGTGADLHPILQLLHLCNDNGKKLQNDAKFVDEMVHLLM